MKEKTLHLKRALRCVLFILLLCMAGMTKGYAYNFSAVCETGQTLYYTITDATNRYVKITYPGSSTSSPWSGFTKPKGTLTIPSSVSNGETTYTVTEIGEYAFSNCDGLNGSLTIPNSVTSIGERAFYNCFGLTGSLTIPNSVTSIGNYAFYQCSGLTSLTIGESVTSIGNYAFFNCRRLTSLTIPNSVTSIGERAFDYCVGLTGSLTIPNSVTSIGNYAFYECSGLTSLTIGESVTSIGNYAFYECSGLTSLTIGNSVTSIGERAFYNCFGLTGSLTIPNSVTSIGNYAFFQCFGLTSLTIGESVTSIGNGAFCNCSGLTSLTIGNSVTSIGNNAFSDCRGLTSLTIPNSVTSIGNYAFYECSGLTSLTIGESVTSIGNYAFFNCSGLTGSLTIPNSVSSIGERAFCDCSGLTSLTIPNSVTSIEDAAFVNCPNIQNIMVDEANTVYDSRENCNAIIEANSNKLILGCKNTIIPNSVTSIGERAFCGCSGLTSLTIPNSVTSIGDFAFSGCSGLTSLTIPNSVTSIGNYAFYECSGLTSLTIGESVTSIGERAFLDCSGLTSLTIPNSVTSIGNDAFYQCSGLTSLTIGESVTSIGESAFDWCSSLTSLTIPNSVITIGSRAFAMCSGLTSLTIGESVTSIGDFAFNKCSGLTSLTIPNSVTSIGDYAFYQCSGLTSLTIGESVTSIGNGAFCICSGLTETIICRTNAPILGDEVFGGTNCSIYVPYESINSYKTATKWKSYKDRIYPMAYTTIPSYGESTGNYRFIASPLAGDTDPTAIDNLITASKYDLYRFDQSEDAEWQNYKDPNVNNFTIANGQGYLYANESEVNIIFKGAFNENGTQNVSLAYDDNAAFKGLNLVGNPFPVNAYINRSYYVMNDEGTEVTPIAVSTSTPIPACAGVMVFAESGETDPTVTFSKTAPQSANSNGSLQISVAHNSSKGSAIIDNAIVSFNDGDALGKYNFNDGDARLYIQQGSKELAIAYAGNQGEMPLNFKAKANGTYKISVNPEDVEMEYLHIIDNLTGNDTDLLQTPSYTFDASKADYASRFKLVFKANGVADNSSSADSETFAYCNGSEWVIENEGEATLQVIDLTGRILISEQISGSCSKTFSSHGVNMLRLINGDSVKTQKIVVR